MNTTRFGYVLNGKFIYFKIINVEMQTFIE